MSSPIECDDHQVSIENDNDSLHKLLVHDIHDDHDAPIVIYDHDNSSVDSNSTHSHSSSNKARLTDQHTFSYRLRPNRDKAKATVSFAPTEISEPIVPKKRNTHRLSYASQFYDVDGDGKLNQVEQALRDRDLDGRGYLTPEEIYSIVHDQMQDQKQVRTYTRLAVLLLGLALLMAVSNLGTSFASAILARDTKTDAESGAIMFKDQKKVVGYDVVADMVELTELDDEEYAERRARVLKEMHMGEEDHDHRRLGKSDNGSWCSCQKVAFDQGKVMERDLNDIVKKCDGVNTVTVKRMWKNEDGGEDYDTSTICSPGVTVVKKGKRVKNKKQNKVKIVTERVTFKRDRRDEDQDLTFDCKKGWCHASGGLLQQRQGHPCLIQRGQDECTQGLLCYGGEGVYSGTGVCTSFAKFRKEGEMCDISLGLESCNSRSTCIGKAMSNVGVGVCTRIIRFAKFGQICDASYGDSACMVGYSCIDLEGNAIAGNVGTGVCGTITTRIGDYGTAKWWVDYKSGSEGQCVRDCPAGVFNNCGGFATKFDETFTSADECCRVKLWWLNFPQCIPDWPLI